MNEATCGSCKFFQRTKFGSPNGNCRALPPTLILLAVRQDGAVTDSFWPVVPDTEWCGAWRPRANGAASEIDLSRLDTTGVEAS